MMINWQDSHFKISDHFCVKEAIWLPQWNRLATEKDGLTTSVEVNLISLFQKLDIVRDFLGVSILVHVSFRPVAYNTLVKGAKNSAHLYGMACDWSAPDFGSCDKIRAYIVPKLKEWKLRCEDRIGSNWVHLDKKKPGWTGKYFFIPS